MSTHRICRRTSRLSERRPRSPPTPSSSKCAGPRTRGWLSSSLLITRLLPATRDANRFFVQVERAFGNGKGVRNGRLRGEYLENVGRTPPRFELCLRARTHRGSLLTDRQVLRARPAKDCRRGTPCVWVRARTKKKKREEKKKGTIRRRVQGGMPRDHAENAVLLLQRILNTHWDRSTICIIYFILFLPNKDV